DCGRQANESGPNASTNSSGHSGMTIKQKAKSNGGSAIKPARDVEVLRNPEFEELVRRQLELIGEDAEREGLADTPKRVSKSMRWLTQGYRTCVQDVVGSGVFKSEG